jgi:hypothetical protein
MKRLGIWCSEHADAIGGWFIVFAAMIFIVSR